MNIWLNKYCSNIVQFRVIKEISMCVTDRWTDRHNYKSLHSEFELVIKKYLHFVRYVCVKDCCCSITEISKGVRDRRTDKVIHRGASLLKSIYLKSSISELYGNFQ